MQTHAHTLPNLAPPGPSRSPYRCRAGSTTKPVRCAPISAREAGRLYDQAKRMECATRRPGCHNGAVTRVGLAVLHTLLFTFANRKTGRCDPSHAAIARRAGVSVRSVVRGLKALRAAGLVNWLRRCVEVIRDGRFSLEQQSNAYAILPDSQWRGWGATPAPLPEAGTWGDHPPLPDAITAALQDSQAGCSRAAFLAALESDPGDGLASALARLGRLVSGQPKAGNA